MRSPPKRPRPRSRSTSLPPRAAVHEAHPSWRIDSVSPPADETGLYGFWVDKGFSTWTGEGDGGNTFVNVDQYTGKFRYVGAPGDGNVFGQAWDDSSLPLHTGDVFGEPSRILRVFVALSPLVMGGKRLAMNRIPANVNGDGAPVPRPRVGWGDRFGTRPHWAVQS